MARRQVDTAIAWLVLGVALVPLLAGELNSWGVSGARVLYDPIALPRLVFSYAIALAALAALGRGGRRSVPVHGALVAFAVVAVLAAVSTVTSYDPLHSILGQSERLEGLLTWCLYPLLAFTAAAAVTSTRDLVRIGRALAASAALAAGHGLLQFFGAVVYRSPAPTFAFDQHRAFATFENPNFLAGLLVLALPAAVSLAFSEDEQRWRWIAGAEAVVIAAAIVATMTRGAWLAVGLQAGIALLFLGTRRAVDARRLAVAAVVGLALAAVVGGISVGRAADADALVRLRDWSSLSERFAVWETAGGAIGDRPLLGWGPDGFLAAFRANRTESFTSGSNASATINNAHSWPIQTAVTLGLPAAVLFAGGLVWALAATFAVVRRKGARGAAAVYFGLWLGCLGFVIHLLGNVAVTGATTPFFIVVGALLGPLAHRAEPRRWSAAFAWVPVVALVVVLVGGGVLLTADSAYWRARTVRGGVGTGDAAALSTRAWKLNPTSVKYARGRAEIVADRFYDGARAGVPSREDFDAAMSAFDSDRAAHPSDYATLAWQAALAATGARVFEDSELAAMARRYGAEAARLDADAEQVARLAAGSVAEQDCVAARGVPGLP